jgi:hypothetical protein
MTNSIHASKQSASILPKFNSVKRRLSKSVSFVSVDWQHLVDEAINRFLH